MICDAAIRVIVRLDGFIRLLLMSWLI